MSAMSKSSKANPPAQVRPSRNGLGLFAVSGIRRGGQACVLDGNLVHWEDLIDIGGIILDNAYRYSDDYYLSPSGVGNYINHSCEPNIGIRKVGRKLVMAAIRQIRAGEELAFDYSTVTGDDDSWTMRCKCGSGSCRKLVGPYGRLPRRRREKYSRQGIVPDCVLMASLSKEI